MLDCPDVSKILCVTFVSGHVLWLLSTDLRFSLQDLAPCPFPTVSESCLHVGLPLWQKVPLPDHLSFGLLCLSAPSVAFFFAFSLFPFVPMSCLRSFSYIIG